MNKHTIWIVLLTMALVTGCSEHSETATDDPTSSSGTMTGTNLVEDKVIDDVFREPTAEHMDGVVEALGASRIDEADAILSSFLGHSDPAVVYMALSRIKNFKGTQVVPLVARSLRDHRAVPSDSPLYGGEIQPAVRFTALESPMSQDFVVKDPSINVVAAATVSRVNAVQFAPRLVDMVQARTGNDQIAGIMALAAINYKNVMVRDKYRETITTWSKKAPDPITQMYAMFARGRMGDKAVVGYLFDLTLRQDGPVQATCIWLIQDLTMEDWGFKIEMQGVEGHTKAALTKAYEWWAENSDDDRYKDALEIEETED